MLLPAAPCSLGQGPGRYRSDRLLLPPSYPLPPAVWAKALVGTAAAASVFLVFDYLTCHGLYMLKQRRGSKQNSQTAQPPNPQVNVQGVREGVQGGCWGWDAVI